MTEIQNFKTTIRFHGFSRPEKYSPQTYHVILNFRVAHPKYGSLYLLVSQLVFVLFQRKILIFHS